MKRKLCAVYGSLKAGKGNHRLLENAKFIGTTKTSSNYTMYSLGGFPGIKENGNTAIHLEVYEVTKQEDKRIELLEGYIENDLVHSMYLKKEIETEFGPASIYIYNLDVETRKLPIVESGNW